MALKLIIVGALSKDATANKVGDNIAINFTIPHTDKIGKEKKEKTTWVECVLWVKEDKLSQYFKKGTQLYVEGMPEANAFKTNDGNVKGTLQVRVSEFQFVPGGGKGNSSSSGSSSNQSSKKTSTASAPASEEQPDDLPF